MIADFAEYRANYEFSSGGLASAQRLDVKLRAAGRRPASSGAPLAAHPIMPVQVARRRANSRCGSRLGRREKRRRTVNFNDELGSVRDAQGQDLLSGSTQSVKLQATLVYALTTPNARVMRSKMS